MLFMMCCLLFLPLGDTVFTTSSFKMEAKQRVVSYEALTTAKSVLDCARQCVWYSHCLTVGFNASSEVCYLHPDFSHSVPVSSASTDTAIFKNSNPVCSEADAPTIAHGNVTSLRRSLTSLEGSVTCDDRYIFSNTEVPTLSCRASGQWTLNGECRQWLWKTGEVSVSGMYLLPRPMEVGQSICLTGFPTDSSRIAFNLYDNANNIHMHMNVRFSETSTVFDYMVNGQFLGNRHLWPPQYPFLYSVGTSFTWNITATDLNTLQVNLNGNHFYSWTTYLNITDIVKVELSGGLQVNSMNLMCVQ